MSTITAWVRLTSEIDKLKKRKHPRVQVEQTSRKLCVSIDLWCDGDENEVTEVTNMTTGYRRAFNTYRSLTNNA